ncbi:MAG TPA: MMPL family transporter, partial [Thermomicrobiales bacterium]|nr:MMPL family transporter [Thermomicrobiales bacterium]
MFTRWGRILYTHRTLVLFLSAVGLIASIASIITFGATLSDEGFFNEESESALVDERIGHEFGGGAEQIVFLFDAPGPISDPATRAAVEDALEPLTPEKGVLRVLTTWSTGNPGFISEDGQSTYAVALLDDEGEEDAGALQEAVTARAEAAGLEIGITGGPAIGEAIVGAIEDGLLRAELVSVPLAILIQLVVFGGLVAAGVPLLVAMFAIVGAIAVIFGLSGMTEQSV